MNWKLHVHLSALDHMANFKAKHARVNDDEQVVPYSEADERLERAMPTRGLRLCVGPQAPDASFRIRNGVIESIDPDMSASHARESCPLN
ncbi:MULTISPECIES: hypothetical protein [unclassified Caballeronia]|uniref:hypothetical protein n=1 Tax=unclassified Caballeronia TaxID=2646786 RepID=UPI001F431C57|nr:MULTISPECIES: hypothetical protein [unclassified Caballeronia]MCE4546891.1 hypothetical protein [Caballeronia sp. PC1]MCE4572636.1 hypothetical protein [Caballeronia sp. CLC5]